MRGKSCLFKSSFVGNVNKTGNRMPPFIVVITVVLLFQKPTFSSDQNTINPASHSPLERMSWSVGLASEILCDRGHMFGVASFGVVGERGA